MKTRYIPENSTQIEKYGSVVYTYVSTKDGKPAAIAYTGIVSGQKGTTMNRTIIEVMRNYARKQADRTTAKNYFTAAQILSDNWTKKYNNGSNVIDYLHGYVMEGYKLQGTRAVKGEMIVNLRTRHTAAIFSAIETAETLNEWMTCSKCADSVLFTESHFCTPAPAVLQGEQETK